MGAIIGGELDCVDSPLGTMYHGSSEDRQYERRHMLLRDFDPHTDLAMGDSGAWRRASHKPVLHEEASQYLSLRCEDD